MSRYSADMHNIEVEIKRIPGKIQELEDDFSKFRSEFDEASNRLDELNKAYRGKEVELKDSQENVKNRESKLYMIKTNKEYQAAVTEIAESKRINKEIENQMLAILEELESLEPRVKEQQPIMDAKAEEFAEEKATLESTLSELKKKLAWEQQAWKERTQDIDKEFLDKYEAARRLNTDVIAILAGNTCQGCFMSVPPQLVIEVLRLKTLHSCPNCQRLLFVKETVEDEGIAPPEA